MPYSLSHSGIQKGVFKNLQFKRIQWEFRKLQRNFLSGVVTVELDGNGRFLLPRNLLTYAQIDKEAILVGMGSKVEIWSPAVYEKQKITDPAELSKLAQKHLNE